MDQQQVNPPVESSVSTGKTTKKIFSKNGLRQVVSQRRVRFQDGEYDLDLSYICPNIIAMGLPASGVDSMYRNNEQDVASMLNKFHPNSYMIYNLAQKKYDYELFNNRVMDLGWKDHHAPALELLFRNVNSMAEFIRQDPNHVVIVHCKAGKGRTGTSIAALLYYSGLYNTVGDALRYFSYRRAHTIDPKGGVTIPSQKRYINYFAEILSGVRTPNRNMYKIDSITISGVPMYDKHGSKLFVKIMHETVDELYCGKKECIKLEPVTQTSGIFNSPELCNVELCGDIMLKFHHQKLLGDESKFRIAFNTHMIEGDQIYWVFYKHDLDDAYKDELVPGEFKLELRMSKCGEMPENHLETVPEWKKAIENRHLYQKMFTKMSYQQGGAYDPANDLDHVENDDFTAFLSVPIDVSATNGVPPQHLTIPNAASLSPNGPAITMASSAASPSHATSPSAPRGLASPTADGRPPALPTKKKPTLASFKAKQPHEQDSAPAPAPPALTTPSTPSSPTPPLPPPVKPDAVPTPQTPVSPPPIPQSPQSTPPALPDTIPSQSPHHEPSSSLQPPTLPTSSSSSSSSSLPTRPNLAPPLPPTSPSQTAPPTSPTAAPSTIGAGARVPPPPVPTPRSVPPPPATPASPSLSNRQPPPATPASPAFPSTAATTPSDPLPHRPAPAVPSTPRPTTVPALPSISLQHPIQLPPDGTRPAPPPPRPLNSPANLNVPIVIQPHVPLQPPTLPSSNYQPPS